MASSTSLQILITLLMSLSLLLPSALAGVICEELPQDLCAYSISSTSKRCVVEIYHHHRDQAGGQKKTTEYQCRTSEVVVERMSDWIESDQCVRECGVDRNVVGISSDTLLDTHLTARLCSPPCFANCPNIVDLYFNLAAAEGVFLPDLCDARLSHPHRAMVELMSSGVAAGPVSSEDDVSKFDSYMAPAPSPNFF